MTDLKSARGFSFELSESPPPAEARRLDAGLDSLDLDFAEMEGDTGGADGSPHASSPAPLSTRPRVRAPHIARSRTLMDSAPPPALTAKSAAPPAAARERAPEVATPNARAPQGALDALGRRPLARQVKTQTLIDSVPPPASVDAAPPHQTKAAPQPASGALKAVAGVHPAHPAMEADRAATAPTANLADAPAIKRITFPAKKPEPTRSSVPQTSAAPKARTHFSPSVQTERPPLESSDDILSEPPAAPESDLAAPEDLPDWGAFRAKSPAPASAWAHETPTARELWAKARDAFSQTSELTARAGTRGAELASGMSAALKQRLTQAREAHSAQALKAKRDLVDRDALETGAAEFPRTEASTTPPTTTRPTTTEVRAPRISSALTRSPLLGRAGKKLIAPTAALLMAGAVYLGAGHLLGGSADIALSKTGPAVPELGTLQGADSADNGAPASDSKLGGGPNLDRKAQRALGEDRSAPAAEGSGEGASGPPPLQTEELPLPSGLSWPGKGLLEVVTAEDELVYVNGVFTGRGPLRRVPVTPGDHEISIRKNGKRREGVAAVKMDRTTRAVFASE